MKQRNNIDWTRHLADWKASGRTQAEYCRQHDLKPYLFTYWKKRLAERTNLEPDFVALPAVARQPVFELRVHRGFRIEFSISFSGSLFS